MLTAAEARVITNANKPDTIVLDELEKAIKETAEQGNYSFIAQLEFNVDAIKTLRDNGYRVSVSLDDDLEDVESDLDEDDFDEGEQVYYLIEWGEEEEEGYDDGDDDDDDEVDQE